MGNRQPKPNLSKTQRKSTSALKISESVLNKSQSPNETSINELCAQKRSNRRDRFLSTFCIKRKMKTSQTQLDNRDSAFHNVPQRSTTDPDLLLISGDTACPSNEDLIDLTISDEYNRKFHEDINKRLNTLGNLVENSDSDNLNETYDDDVATMLPKLQNIQRNVSILTKSPALHNINIYTNLDENNNFNGKTQVKDLLNEQQVNENDYMDLTSVNQEFESYVRNEQSSQIESELSESSSSLSSISSTSTLQYSTQIKSQIINDIAMGEISLENSSPILNLETKKAENLPKRRASELGSIGYIDQTLSSSRQSSLNRNKVSMENKFNRQEEPTSGQYSAIPWFMFYNELTRKLVQHRQKKQKLELKRNKKIECKKRLSVETLQNLFYDKSIIERIINKDNSYAFNDNSNSEIQIPLTENSNIIETNKKDTTPTSSFNYSLELRKTRASLASSEHLTPLTRSNDYLNKIEFLNSKKQFINNDEVIVKLNGFRK
jgi:hypothetical protein